MRSAPPVELSPEERVALERWVRAGPRPDLRARKARIVLRAAEGSQDIEIARELGLHRLTVGRWRKRFLTERLRAVEERTPSGARLGRIPDERVRGIVAATAARDGSGPGVLSTRALARRFGVSHSTVRRIWNAYGIRPRRFEPLPLRADPRPLLVPSDVVGLYLRPPDYAMAFVMAPIPSTPGREAVVSLPTPRVPTGVGKLLDGVTEALRATSPARDRNFLRFLSRVGPRAVRPRELLLIASRPGVPPSAQLRRWLTRHPSAKLALTEGRESWESQIAVVFRALAERSPAPRNFGWKGELARAIRLFLATYHDRAGPFEWVASGLQSRRDSSGYRLRYELSVTGHAGFKREGAVGRAMPVRASDPRAREMARVVLRKSLRVRKGERVTIATWSETLPFANAMVLEALQLGAWPLLLLQDEPTYWAATSEVPATHLSQIGDHLRAALRQSDVFVTFYGPSDRERFHSLPEAVRFRLGEREDHLYAAAAKGGARAVQVALGRASAASAQMYAVDLARWRDEMVQATLVDPEKLHQRAVRISEALRTGRRLHLTHPNGTDLTLGLRRRKPQVSDGRVPRARPDGGWNLVQLPAGVVTVALDERTAEGTFRSNVPNTIGVMDTIGEVADGRWRFTQGRLASYSYHEGQQLFSQSYQRAGPGKERPGTFSVGLNERIEISPLLMDQGLGTVTLQIGRNDVAGGATRTSWWAWLLLRGADLAVDGRTIVKGGRLT